MGWTDTRSKIAHAKRRDPNADVTELRRQLKAERLADYIERTVAEAPEIDQETRDRLAALLRPSREAASV